MGEVSLVKGDWRRKNIFDSLKFLEKDIKEKIGGKTVLIKPNFVSVEVQKAATHIDHIRGILDFLKGFYQGKVIIAEGAAGDTQEGFRNFGYFDLQKEYSFKIEFLDLNKDDFEEFQISKREKIRIARTILNPAFFIISAAKLKTHDTVIATLSLKNLAVGMIVGGDKSKIHQGIKEINQNLFLLAKKRMPDLASIDGFEAMEGEGPIIGDVLKLKLAIASLDSLAADRVALEIMGINPREVGYLVYCARAGLGKYNLNEIEILGKKIEDCKYFRPFRLHSRYKEMLLWKEENPPEGLGRPISY